MSILFVDLVGEAGFIKVGILRALKQIFSWFSYGIDF
jgi:hypothetical protein